MPVDSIKGLLQGYRPWIAYTVTLSNGRIFGFGTATDNITDSVAWQGVAYWAVVADQNLQAMQASNTLGTSSMGSIAISLADADATWWSVEASVGFAGALITADVTYYDTNTNTFASDSRRIFNGICDAATRSGQLTHLTAVSNYSLTKSIAPPMPIQRNCPKRFPSTYSQRADGAGNTLSPYWDCGYSPDISGGVGNYGPNGPYTICAKTPTDCKARGMWQTDAAGRNTKRFGGSQWVPPATWKGESYTDGKTTDGVNTECLAKYNQFVPITFGTTWVKCPCANGVGDPNSSEFEVLCGYGDYTGNGVQAISNIQIVLCQNLEVPPSTATTDLLFRWYMGTTGNRSGNFHQGGVYGGNGDPYGSILCLYVVVYSQVAASNTAASVQVLVGARPIPVYSAPGVFSWQQTDLVAWVVYELIRLEKPDLYALIDVNSVIAYAQVCGTVIGYTRTDGSAGSHRRYGVAISVEQPVSLSTLIESLKLTGDLMILQNPNGSGFRFVARQSLADQQPGPNPDSNDLAAYPSYRAQDNPNGSPTGNGYPAYSFDDTNILPGSVNISQDTLAKQPTVWQANIQDEDNSWTPDSVREANLDLYAISQENSIATYNAAGLPNYDQAYRVIKTKMAEVSQGNPRKDNKGSWILTWETNAQANHLCTGSLIRFSYLPLAIAPCFLRVEGIGPTADYRTVSLTARYIDDRWYCDGFGGTQSGVSASTYPNAQGNIWISDGTDSSGNPQATVYWTTSNTSGNIAVYAGSTGGSVVGTGTSGSVTNDDNIWISLGAPPLILVDLTTGAVLASYNGGL
jgi:hypothetical protein